MFLIDVIFRFSCAESILLPGVSFFPRIASRVGVFACGAVALTGFSRADVFLNVPEAADYQIAYELDIPLNGGFQGATAVPYATDNSATAAPGGFDRIAYYLELTGVSGTSWAYASMDAFTTLATRTGLPHDVSNPLPVQQGVTNLAVFSNVPGVKTGAFDRGQIEMWHQDYTKLDPNAVFAASGSTWDWGDTIGTTPSGYGSFQIHNPGCRQVVFAYNRWAAVDATNDDVGIGNSPGTHSDWTTSANTASYTARKLVVLLQPKRFNVAFTNFPANQQITPRNVATNLAVVPVSGSENVGGFDRAVLRILRDGVAVGADLEQNLVYNSGTASFSFSPTIPAELASNTFQLYLKKGTELRLVRQCTDVTAGDVFLWYGQSNAEGIKFVAGDSANAYASPWIRTFGMSSDSATVTQAYPFWVQADGDGSRDIPAGVGQWPLVVGRRIVDAEGIPVAIINGSRAGYAINQLQRDDANPDNLADSRTTTYRVYNRLRYRAIQAKVAEKVRAIFFYQGESDNNDAILHEGGFTALMNDWQVDYPGVERVFVSQVHVGCGGDIVARDQPALRNYQRLLPDIYPTKVRVMSTNGLTAYTDNCHFPFTGGYETHGLNSFAQTRRELYGAPDAPAIDPPNPASVEVANAAGDRLRIVMRKSGAGITVDPEALVDFRLNGSSATLASVTVTPAAIELQYDRSVNGATSLDYLAHKGNTPGWVRNSNGVALLAFSEPIINKLPQLNLISPTGVSELAPGSVYPLSASATSSAATISRMEILIDGILHTAINSAGPISANWTVPASGAHAILFRAIDSTAQVVEKSVVILAGITTSPAGVGSGLKVWLRPEAGISRDAGGAISSWANSIGTSNTTPSQATGSAQPTYVAGVFGSMPGVSFDGNDFLAAGSGMSTGSYTKVVRVRISSLTQSGNMLSSGGTTNSPTRHALFMGSTAYPRLWHRGDFATSTTPMVAGQEHILVGTYDTSVNLGKLYLDGVEVGSGTSTAFGDNADPTYQVGALAGANFFSGSIGEVMIYNRVLDSTERANLLNYLAAKSQNPPAAPRLSYTAWSGGNITPPADDTPGGDANHNGIPNLIEFALGLGPGFQGNPLSLDLTTNPGGVIVKYTRPTDRDGVSYQLYESTGLDDWSPVNDLAGSVTAGIEERVYTRPATLLGKTFYRLLVTLSS